MTSMKTVPLLDVNQGKRLSKLYRLRGTTNEHRTDHCIRRIASRPWHLLHHVCDSIVADQGQGGLEKSQNPRHPIAPASGVGEVFEDEFSVRFGGCGQDCDADDDAAHNRPTYCSHRSGRANTEQKMKQVMPTSALIPPSQNPVSEDIEQHSERGDADEDQVCPPRSDDVCTARSDHRCCRDE